MSAFFHRLFQDERGQALPVIAFMMVALIAMTGFAIDVGRVLYANRELQASTDAAALAGASALPLASATATATQYSSVPGALNARNDLPGVTMVAGYPQVRCLTTLTSQGMACAAPASGNAITVKQQANVSLTFMRVVGINSLNVAASATAAMRGSTAAPYNVAVVLDTTASMNDYDSDSNCAGTRISCALSGVQALLGSLSPCGSSQATCGPATNGNVLNAVDKVSLYTFPGLTSTSQATNDYDCSGSAPQIAKYAYPTLPTYQIVPYSSDYRSSDTSGLLSTSNLVTASGGKSGCPGMQAIGGVGTYYASAIYAAQADLVNQASTNPGTQNVMIILSDGDASTQSTQVTGFSTSKSAGVYPSIYNQCQQAVTAAQSATAAGTRVYTVAYGAASSGCSTDTTGITPCQTMRQMATADQYFFSDYTASSNSGSCISASQPTSGLTQIFAQIASDLTVGRLIPDNTP